MVSTPLQADLQAEGVCKIRVVGRGNPDCTTVCPEADIPPDNAALILQ
jgi:hypothetical protein